jgi:hypothetical protein
LFNENDMPPLPSAPLQFNAPAELEYGPSEDPADPIVPVHNSRPPYPAVADWATAIPGNIVAPIAMAIGMNMAFSGVAGR